MKIMAIPALAEVAKISKHASINREGRYFCGFPFSLSRSTYLPEYVHVAIEGQAGPRLRQVGLLGLSAVGISKDHVVCFRGRIDYDTIDLELDGSDDPLKRQLCREVIEFLTFTGSKPSEKLELKVLIFVDMIAEEAIMVEDYGQRY